MPNLMDLIREIQGVRHQAQSVADPRTVGRGYEPELDGPAVDDSGIYEPGIQVDGSVPRARPVDQSQYLLSAAGAPDLRNTEWAQAAVDAKNENDKKVQHKGMFGVKGTLRSVLGVLGDAFLVQGGAKPVYAPQRERERMGDAMAGMTQAPRAAVERMTAVNPEFARELGETVSRQELAQAAAEAARAKEIAVRREKGIAIVGAMMGANGLEDAATYEKMKPIMQNLIKSYGLEDTYSVPETYDPNFAATLANASMSPYQQAQDENTDERTALTEQRNAALNAQAAARLAEQRRANQAREQISRSKGGSKGPQPTEAAEIARIRSKVDNGTPLKPGERATWDKYLSGGKTSKTTNRRPVSTNSRFKIRAVRDN